jgi:hypothetical protein
VADQLSGVVIAVDKAKSLGGRSLATTNVRLLS